MADIEDIAVQSQATQIPRGHHELVQHLLTLPAAAWDTPAALRESIWPMCRAMKIGPPSKRALGIAYRAALEADPSLVPNPAFQSAMVHKAVRSASGILNISVSLPAGDFSCKYNCHFCPNEPGMPRSYLSNEDVFKRAAEVGFDTVQQVYLRFMNLATNGHTIDKIEFRVLGGTFSCYDHAVADEFIRDLYYAANTYYEERGRPRGTIEEEQARNVTARVHVVGLGVETRPDEIKPAEIVRFRRYGITRVEIGVQHTDDALLRRVNRGHGVKHSRTAVRLLKDYGFKVEMHIMADLPGATPEGDKECYREVLTGEDLIPDYLKDYPCLDVDFTRIKEWKAAGIWQPYAERTPDARELKDVLIYRQSITPPWVRVNRVQRDFQEAREGCLGYTSQGIRSNLAQIVKDEAEAQGIYCQCIRCCEVRGQSFNPAAIKYTSTLFPASGGQEVFLAASVPAQPRPILLGFLRLRMSDALQESIIPELSGKTAMIRELHVYGSLKAVGAAGPNGAQHLGIGRKLLETAEGIAMRHGYKQIAVISGIGVRGYYQKNGYELCGSYMMKAFPNGTRCLCYMIVMSIVLAIAISMILTHV
jgi:ELP3 family radical SAM enzyme/protein acetyltransferase